MDLCVDALGAMAELGLSPRPKFHAWVHLATDVYEKGSPAVHACWVDEGLNKILKATGSGAHRSGWYERALQEPQAQVRLAQEHGVRAPRPAGPLAIWPDLAHEWHAGYR